MENKKKKRYGIVAALLLLVLAAGVGTYAWLTATQSLENVFTVGSINTPEKKPDPNQPDKPGPENNDGKAYLFETKWKDSSKIVPGSSTDKNPNVGIAKGSDDAYVFIYVKNAMVKDGTDLANTPYFSLNANWKAVDGQVTTSADGKYLSGLFMYAKGATSGPAVLGAENAAEDVYTGELFSKVLFPSTLEGSMVAENPKMTVSAYIFGADQKGEEATPAANAVAQAKEWAKAQK
ncbi:SipW-dependent-type signal peptide-containing protein [Collinsella aerofaciens]|uniref:SipW-dependent-type signal peptide-containing protein n=1 Tax=Collinsella aerofaciens TaxID=74426 RepID=UPI0020973E76|nr:SipW-dependent-type signal peptide-containing protein [Collinsella aerofaciens]MCO7116337.1 SipW-dependent-type signal peptide-containing protein [Collinsella aerofaciens]